MVVPVPGDRRSIIIDARVNGFAGAHGLARSVIRLAEHLVLPGTDVALRVLVNPGREQLFPLARLAERAELIETDITIGALHRCGELARLIHRLRAGVLYVPYPPFRPILCPCPVVVTIHDCIAESDASFAGGWHRQAGIGLVTRRVLTRAAAVTTPTRASLAQVKRYYPAAANPVVIPNGVDSAPFTAVAAVAAAAASARYRLPERFILAVGARRPHKNHEVLISAMRQVPSPLSLVIVGYPDSRFPDSIPRLIAELGLGSRVRLLPSVDDVHLPAVYHAASAFAFPSLAEGFGLPALEAMAARIPVVASAIGAFEEVCGGAATLVPARDPAAWAAALTEATGNGPGVRDQIAAGAAVAAAATWDRGGQALGELLSSVALAGEAALSGNDAHRDHGIGAGT